LNKEDGRSATVALPLTLLNVGYMEKKRVSILDNLFLWLMALFVFNINVMIHLVRLV